MHILDEIHKVVWYLKLFMSKIFKPLLDRIYYLTNRLVSQFAGSVLKNGPFVITVLLSSAKFVFLLYDEFAAFKT